MKTLHLYVSRELFKNFALTAIGLTLTFSLCGGVMNMMETDALTGEQLLKILAFVIPVATTLTLPVAALYACAIVYGRFAADNELDACRASGINIYRLLMPAMLLSLFTASFTFSFTNYVIPRFIEGLEVAVKQDLQKIVLQALSTRGYFRYGPYVMSASRTTGDMLRESGQTKMLDIPDAAFIELNDGSLVRAGTAEDVRVDFHSQGPGTNPVIEAAMYRVRAIDLPRNQYYEFREQRFDPHEITQRIDQKPKWLNLTDLLRYKRNPRALSQVQSELAKIRLILRDAMFYRWAIQELVGPSKTLVLQDDKGRLEIRAHRIYPDREDLRPRLETVAVKEISGDRVRTYTASTGTFRMKRGLGEGQERVQLILDGNVVFTDSLSPKSQVGPFKRRELADVAVPAHIRDEEAKVPDEKLLGEDLQPMGLGTRLDNARHGMSAELIKLSLEITGIIHSRLAFSVSTLVLLVLACGLGIIFRGGQFLTAFAISFVPGILVVVLNIMGRQLAENTGTSQLGLGVIWSGIVLLLVADVVVLTRFLKR